jgi:RecJ-like exonuclease
MRFKKIYGQSKINKCPFCNKQATTENKQGVPTCRNHKDQYLDLKCSCGSWLEIRKGKYGVFCSCIKCGNINFNRALEMNREQLQKINKKQNTKSIKKQQKPVIVRSDEVDFLY